MSIESQVETVPSEMPLAPALGYRNYWYPLIESRRVSSRPMPLRILGEDLVLFRAGAKVAALVDRCAHRGARLSKGRVLFPETLSCPYHGWTYNAQGECVAAIGEGPDSHVPGTVRVHAYPTEERAGVVWGFLGEGDPPPLDEDLPPPLRDANHLVHCFFDDWECDWRNLTENYPDLCHVPVVHRTSIDMLFRPVPAWTRMTKAEPLADGKGMVVASGGGGLRAEYPGLGVFPRKTWWRVLSSRHRGGQRNSDRNFDLEVRMPGYIVLPLRHTAIFGVMGGNVQWPVPVEENRTRVFEVTYTRPTSLLHRVGLLTWYHLFYRWEHPRMFASQDRHAVEGQTYRVHERLSTTDVGVVQWRRLSAKIAQERSQKTGDEPLGAEASGNGRQPARISR